MILDKIASWIETDNQFVTETREVPNSAKCKYDDGTHIVSVRGKLSPEGYTYYREHKFDSVEVARDELSEEVLELCDFDQKRLDEYRKP